MLTYILVALGLSADAFAVSVSSGICVKELKFRHALRASLVFGFFQFGMPILGWILGGTFKIYIEKFDHWIAFALLAFVGGRMLKEAFEIEEPSSCSDEEAKKKSILNWGTLVVLAVATSIDALAVGLSYSMLGELILIPALIIGSITFIVCMIGTEFGKRLGARFERWAEVFGGLVLIGIGVKILAEHIGR